MSEIESPDRAFAFGESPDQDLTRYRALSLLAVAGCLAGFAAVAAFVLPSLWPIAVVAAVVNLLALRSIAKSDPPKAGRWLARVGLVFAVVCGVAGPGWWGVHKHLVQEEAEAKSLEWFGHFAWGEPEKAALLSMAPEFRPEVSEELDKKYAADPVMQVHLKQFVSNKLIATLAALGRDAIVRRYQIENHDSTLTVDKLADVYAVTYTEAGKTRTFFVLLELERKVNRSTGEYDWTMKNLSGGYRPIGWRDDGGVKDEG